MSEIFKFFNSAPGDPRTYQATDFADYFGSVLSTGLLHTDNVPGMAVSVVAGTLTTKVTPGKAIMKGHLYENTSDLTLTHTLPEATLDRIDRIVLRLDLRNSERNIKLHVKEGVSSATPVAPTLQRDNFIYEISLARVLVRKNTVQLLAGDLVDERLDENLAGLVYSLISIPTSQFQAEWDAFMAGIEDSGFASAAEFDAHTAEDATLLKKGHVQLSSSVTSTSEVLAATPKAVKTAMDRADAAFQSASDGKTAVASAVTAKGVAASPSDTFPTLATKIGQISTGKKIAKGNITNNNSVYGFLDWNQSQTNLPYIDILKSDIGFIPDTIYVYRTDKAVTQTSTWRKENFYSLNSGANIANLSYAGTALRSGYTLFADRIRIAVSNGSFNYTWEAKEEGV